MEDQKEEIEKILKSLHSLEIRLSRLESALNVNDNKSFYETEEQLQSVDQTQKTIIQEDEDKGLESQIGRFGLAWLGNIVLLFGITFLTEYLMNLGFRSFSILFGYITSGGIFLLANYSKKTNVHLSSVFRINAHVLLFYITVRLHFFSTSPLIPGKANSLAILLLLVVGQIYL